MLVEGRTQHPPVTDVKIKLCEARAMALVCGFRFGSDSLLTTATVDLELRTYLLGDGGLERRQNVPLWAPQLDVLVNELKIDANVKKYLWQT